MRKRVLISGLIAGLIVNIPDGIVSGGVFAGEFKERLARQGLAVKPSAFIFYIVATFVFSVIMMWLYAALKRSYGPGPKTALLTGIITFVLIRLVGFGHVVSGEESFGFYFGTALAQLVGIILGVLAGQKYQDSGD